MRKWLGALWLPLALLLIVLARVSALRGYPGPQPGTEIGQPDGGPAGRVPAKPGADAVPGQAAPPPGESKSIPAVPSAATPGTGSASAFPGAASMPPAASDLAEKARSALSNTFGRLGMGTPDADTGEPDSTGRPYGTDPDDPSESWRRDSYDRGKDTAEDDPGDETTDPDRGLAADSTAGGADTTTIRVTREVAYAYHLFDGFESANGWAVESAADHATLKLAAQHASQGTRTLQADFEARGKGNFELRREVKLDLSKSTGFRVDVYNAAEPMELQIAFRAGTDTTLYTSPRKSLVNGWNKGIGFSLRDVTAKDTGTYGTDWSWDSDNVTRVSLIFHENGQKSGAVFVDNLRFDRAAAELGLRTQPTLKKITASAKAVERYEPVELTVEFDADYQDFFDRAEIDVAACFTAPSGKRLTVHGFVFDTDAEAAKPIWKVRFTPTEVGLWRYDVTAKSAGGEAVSAACQFLCHRKADHHGFVRVAKSDPRYFELDDGSFYYPVGQNICWASKYDYFLEKVRGYGGNYVRVWLCPWNLQLEDPTEPGKYDLRVARQIDDLLDLCAQRGIYLQLVLRYHGMHDDNWEKNPYNTTNGGPCMMASDFFTSLTAKDLHKQFLDYVVARWGYSTALFAWELWNEADLARAASDADLVAWHREMAAYLKKIDAHRHLVTTSVATPGRCNGLFELPDIDFVPVHFYDRDVAARIHENYLRYRKLRKPIFIGEYSGGHKPADDLADTKGVRVHAGLWLALTTPMAGSAMPWWWDTYIDKNDLYAHWQGLVKFAAGHDRRGRNYELVRSKVEIAEGRWASLQGIIAPSEALLWVHDQASIAQAQQADRPLLVARRTVRLEGMLAGTFRIELWDTRAGKVLSESAATTSPDGTLTFDLPPCERDMAVKVMLHKDIKNGVSRPRLTW